jgi:riboflavin synthase
MNEVQVFTGLIEDLGEVKRIEKRGENLSLFISSHLNPRELKDGDSIAVNGACLTLVSTTPQGFTAEVSPETVRRTNLGDLRERDHVNLERALRLSDRLGGHLVSGHVDGTGTLSRKMKEGDFCHITFAAPQEIMRYVIEKGSIAVDGISLTVNQCRDKDFTVTIIPFTLSHTNLGERKVGERVNLEGDLIGKYVEKFIGQKKGAGINKDLLAEHGFM